MINNTKDSTRGVFTLFLLVLCSVALIFGMSAFAEYTETHLGVEGYVNKKYDGDYSLLSKNKDSINVLTPEGEKVFTSYDGKILAKSLEEIVLDRINKKYQLSLKLKDTEYTNMSDGLAFKTPDGKWYAVKISNYRNKIKDIKVYDSSKVAFASK